MAGQKAPSDKARALSSLRAGAVYARSELHAGGLGGEYQRGISYPRAGTHALLFSDPTASPYGYEDGWADGEHNVYRYSGMWFGPGPMTLTRGNAAIIDRSPELHLFIRSGEKYRYEGRFACVDVDQVQGLNKGTREAALLFVLQRVSASEPSDFVSDSALVSSRRVARHAIEPGEMPTVSAAGLPADPEQRRLRLEKALQSHRDIVQSLAKVFGSVGAACSQDPNSYDLLAEWPDGESLLVEAKSLNDTLGQRIRLAIGQLLEYRYRVRRDLNIAPRLAIATNRRIDDPWLVEYLTQELELTFIVVASAGVFVTGPGAPTLLERAPALLPLGEVSLPAR